MSAIPAKGLQISKCGNATHVRGERGSGGLLRIEGGILRRALSSIQVIARYFGKFNKASQGRSVFGNRTSGAFLRRFAWTNIVRHPIVKHAASPDDHELAEHLAWRRRKAPLPINRTA